MHNEPKQFSKTRLRLSQKKRSIKSKRKEDAMDLAELIYDMYKEEIASDKITSGQNNEQKIPVS